MKKIKLKDKEKLMFWAGALFGISGGVIGNILVSSAFTLINNSCKTEICHVGTIIIGISAFIIFFVLTILLIKKINKLSN
jgi:hypothetical protein